MQISYCWCHSWPKGLFYSRKIVDYFNHMLFKMILYYQVYMWNCQQGTSMVQLMTIFASFFIWNLVTRYLIPSNAPNFQQILEWMFPTFHDSSFQHHGRKLWIDLLENTEFATSVCDILDQYIPDNFLKYTLNYKTIWKERGDDKLWINKN